jgi:hypothetical protein
MGRRSRFPQLGRAGPALAGGVAAYNPNGTGWGIGAQRESPDRCAGG